MKISLDWLSDFVDLDGLSPDRHRRPPDHGDRRGRGLRDARALRPRGRRRRGRCRWRSCRSAGDHGALRAARVACGDRTPHHRLRRAQRAAPGMKAPFAPAGVALAGGVNIRVAEVGGQRERGGALLRRRARHAGWHEGLLEMPGLDRRRRRRWKQLIPAEDVIFEIDNKSLTHRPDLWGHYGFARELAAVFGRPLRPLEVADLAPYDHLPAYPIAVDDFDGCPCYCLPRPRRARRRPLAARHAAAAARPRPADLQPAGRPDQLRHARDRPADPRLRRRAARGHPRGADGPRRPLHHPRRPGAADAARRPDDLERAGAGGHGRGDGRARHRGHAPPPPASCWRAPTSSGSRIRRTAVRLDLRTEASQRFEKNQPPVNVRWRWPASSTWSRRPA